jgi:hypothetical protein
LSAADDIELDRLMNCLGIALITCGSDCFASSAVARTIIVMSMRDFPGDFILIQGPKARF